MAEIEKIYRKIKHKLESVLGVSVILKIAEHNTIKRSEGKAQRVIDRRQL